LDYSSAFLKELLFVVINFHSYLREYKEQHNNLHKQRIVDAAMGSTVEVDYAFK